MKLPDKFIHQMSALLGDEVQTFLTSYEKGRYYGLRLNRLKCSDALEHAIPFEMTDIAWCSDGRYYNEDVRPAKDSYYAAGCYYIQEPSAMTPASALAAQEGDLVIDLCAAPGGKTTHIASDLQGTGLIVANDISPSRVKNLNKNVQISGIRNALVLSEDPVKLAKAWPETADKVLVDAPCSGEGMFRKEPKLISSWEASGPESFVEVQRSILTSADALLKKGGVLVYSTCTYNTLENEENIQWFLKRHPEYTLESLSEKLQVSQGLAVNGDTELLKCARVWPHKHKGEGHFIARLVKGLEVIEAISHEGAGYMDPSALLAVKGFLDEVGITEETLPLDRLNRVKDTIYLLPEYSLRTKGLRVFANGWLLGTMKRERFEPSQAFSSGLKAAEVKKAVTFDHMNENVIRYLKGETVPVNKGNGWHLVTVDGMGIGWGKVVNKRLKNKLEPSWRWM